MLISNTDMVDLGYRETQAANTDWLLDSNTIKDLESSNQSARAAYVYTILYIYREP